MLKLLNKKSHNQSSLWDKSTFDAIGVASVIGLHMVSSIVVGAAMGYFLDKWLDCFPYFSGIFLLFGIAAGFYNVWRDAKKIIKAQGNEDKK